MKKILKMKKAIITGINGQDGSYLAEYLLTLGYEVHGVVRSKQFSFPDSFDKKSVTENLMKNVTFHQIDLCNPENALTDLVSDVKPDEIYHLAAQSHVGLSFDQPVYTTQVTGLGTLHVLEAIKYSGQIRKTRLYNALTSEIFGNSETSEFQNESSYMFPENPYACAKILGHDFVNIYRKSYGLCAFQGICFNHESPRRHKSFVTRKITLGIANYLKTGEQISLGNLNSRRDWGYAPEYVQAMHKMMQLEDNGEDNIFVIGTGTSISVRDFLQYACKYAKITSDELVSNHVEEIRPNDVKYLCADSDLAYRTFGWQPEVLVPELIEIMVDADMEMLGISK